MRVAEMGDFLDIFLPMHYDWWLYCLVFFFWGGPSANAR